MWSFSDAGAPNGQGPRYRDQLPPRVGLILSIATQTAIAVALTEGLGTGMVVGLLAVMALDRLIA